MDDNNSQGKFFNGFLLGLLVGAFVVFLLGTKKGKRIWKAISEGGVDNISNLLDEANKSVDLDEVEEDDESPIKEVPVKKKIKQRENFTPREFAVKESPIEEKPKVRRFFRGISRRVN